MLARDRSCPAGGCLVLILTLKDVRNVTLSYSKLVFITIRREKEKEGHICVIQQKKNKDGCDRRFGAGLLLFFILPPPPPKASQQLSTSHRYLSRFSFL